MPRGRKPGSKNRTSEQKEEILNTKTQHREEKLLLEDTNKLCLQCTQECKQFKFIKIIRCPFYKYTEPPQVEENA